MENSELKNDRIKDVSAVKMRLEEEICTLISEVQEFNPSTIERIEVPSALEFQRYVSSNRPVIIVLPPSSTTVHEPSPDRAPVASQDRQWAWSAFTKWTNEYLSKTMGQKEVTVACTPNGWADAVVDDKYFAMPCEKKMTFEQFLDGMPIRTRKNNNWSSNGTNKQEDLHTATQSNGNQVPDPYQEVRYIQLQNGNLMTEYEELLTDIPSDIPFASEALQKKPDAVNFWYGDERSTTSLHKDHYENIYGVITGRKIFTLIPPTEQYCLHEKKYIAATYVDTHDGESQLSHDSSKPRYRLEPMDPTIYTKWIALNPSHEPEDELFEKYPRFHMCRPYRVTLNPGELLYLPAMWYHQVEQEADHEGKCIAVNWWYDMAFEGDRFATSTFISNLVQLIDQIDDT